ncbi:MAG: hypothetical protein ACOYL6_07075 [Bacteriovoracaceae bacterium]
MKNLFLLFCFLFSHTSMALTRPVWAPLKRVYVPKGFDNNDSVEVVVAGELPNPCYSRNTVSVDINQNVIKVKVTALVNIVEDKDCADMIVPYLDTISVGNLQAGDYKVVINSDSQNQLTQGLSIDESSSNAIDEYVYASVKSVEQKGTSNVFTLRGQEISDCYILDRFQFVDNNLDTISVLPIMKKIKDTCRPSKKSFSYSTKIDFSHIKINKPLIHVRTMDGGSVNVLADIKK